MKNRNLTIFALFLFVITGCQSPELKTLRDGFRWYERGEYDRAIEIFSSVLATQHTNTYALAALAGRGGAFAEKKEYTLALEDYDKAIQADPSLARLYYHRGVCWYGYAKKGEWYDEDKLINALADYTKVIELDPAYRAAHINRAAINKMMGKYDLALDDYNKVLELTPNDEKTIEAREKTLKAIREGSKPLVRDDPPPEKVGK